MIAYGFQSIAMVAELINFNTADPSRAHIIPVSEIEYLCRFANVPRDDMIYIRMNEPHFDQAQMFEI